MTWNVYLEHILHGLGLIIKPSWKLFWKVPLLEAENPTENLRILVHKKIIFFS